MSATYKITGLEALRLAERDNLQVYCHANPIDAGGPVTIGTARQIAREDASLVFVTVSPCGWVRGGSPMSELAGYNVSDYFAPSGMYLGPDDEGTEPRWSDANA